MTACEETRIDDLVALTTALAESLDARTRERDAARMLARIALEIIGPDGITDLPSWARSIEPGEIRRAVRK